MYKRTEPTDSLDAFASESAPVQPGVPFTGSPTPASEKPPLPPAMPSSDESLARRLGTFAALGALVVVAISGIYLLQRAASASPAPPAATVTFESDPSGAEVVSAGVPRGMTPLTLSVAPGSHAFEVVHGGRRQIVRVIARPDATLTHTVHFHSDGALPAGSTDTDLSTASASADDHRGQRAGSATPLPSPSTGRRVSSNESRSTSPGNERRHRAASASPSRSPSTEQRVPSTDSRSPLTSPSTEQRVASNESASPGTEYRVPSTDSAATVIDAEPITERLPAWNPPDDASARTEYRGIVRVQIASDGKVTMASIVQPSHPQYDLEVLKAATSWVYKPATVGGQPVASHKDIIIRLVPR